MKMELLKTGSLTFQSMSYLIRLLLTFFLLMAPLSGNSQVTVIESSKGKGSIFNDTNIGLGANFTNAKISFSQQKALTGFLSGITELSGYEIGIKAKDGTASILKNGELTPELEGALFWGRNVNKYIDNDSSKGLKSINTWFLRGSVDLSNINLADSLFNSKKLSTSNFGIEIGFNSERYRDNRVFGASLTIGTTNNLNELTKSNISSIQFNSDSSKAIQSDEKTAYLYQSNFEDNLFLMRFKLDRFSYPFGDHTNLAVNVFNRIEYINKHRPWSSDLGLGLFAHKGDKEISNMLGGIIIELEDVFDFSGKNTEVLDKLIISITVGYKFK